MPDCRAILVVRHSSVHRRLCPGRYRLFQTHRRYGPMRDAGGNATVTAPSMPGPLVQDNGNSDDCTRRAWGVGVPVPDQEESRPSKGGAGVDDGPKENRSDSVPAVSKRHGRNRRPMSCVSLATLQSFGDRIRDDGLPRPVKNIKDLRDNHMSINSTGHIHHHRNLTMEPRGASHVSSSRQCESSAARRQRLGA